MVEADRISRDVSSLYRRVLQSDWDVLPAALKEFHDVHSVHHFVGRADVHGATGLLARGIAWMIGFPRTCTGIPVHVRLETDGVREIWTRTFGMQTFSSTQHEGVGRNSRFLVERFGGFAFGLEVVVADGTLALQMRRWTLFGVPLPRRLAPQPDAIESELDGRFRFDVKISVPLAGRLVHYTGTLVPIADDLKSSE